MPGIFYGSSSSAGPFIAQLMAFTRDDKGYYILGFGKKESFEINQPIFESMVNGMEFISQEKASKINPPRMRIHMVSSGDTWEKITSNYYNSSREKGKLAEYNGMDDKKEPVSGVLLKIPPSLRYN